MYNVVNYNIVSTIPHYNALAWIWTDFGMITLGL